MAFISWRSFGLRSACAAVALAAAGAAPALVPQAPLPETSTAAAAPTTPEATTRPAAATTQATDAQINEAIDQLGSADFAAREKAAHFLWSIGERAVPFLKEAAGGDDPEVARRAKSVLDNFDFGVRPDTPRLVFDLLNQYRSAATDEQRVSAVRQLAGQDVAGARVLLRLERDEKDPDTHLAIVESLATAARPAAARLIAEHDDSTAAQLLRLVAPVNELTARDWAAYLLIHGGIDDEIKHLETAPKKENSPRELSVAARLVYLYRARGDLGAARKAAEADDDPVTAEAVLAEAGDWKTLAQTAAARGAATTALQEMGYITAYYRLAGNTAAADEWAAKIVAQADENLVERRDAGEARLNDVAEALLLNDHVDDAMTVLRKQKDYGNLLEFLEPRLQAHEAPELLEKARASERSGLPRLIARATPALHFMGRYKEARAAIEEVATGVDGAIDFDTYLAMIEAARIIGEPREKVDAWCIAAMEMAKPHDAIDRLLERAGFARSDQAGEWWPAMRRQHPDEPKQQTFARLRALDRNELSAQDLKELTSATVRGAERLSAPEREQQLLLMAHTLADTGHAAEAIAVLDKATQTAPTLDLLVYLGDLHAAAKDWKPAIDAYSRAAAKDTSHPVPLLLCGWAMTQAGIERGRDMIQTAHLMCLGDESARHGLIQTLAKHHLTAEIARERELIVRTCEFNSWDRADTLRRWAEDKATAGDYADAAAIWDQAFLTNLNTQVTFVEPSANLLIPVLVHRTRAQAAIKARQIDEALRQAKICLDNCPADADSQIAIINDLRDAGRQAESDAQYARVKQLYTQKANDYPNSGPANNLLAWFESRCKRDLDDALAHATKAAEIEPSSTAILDTLAEAHFQRGEIDAALDLVHKCLQLEPGSEHHKKNLERFEAAKKGTSSK